LVTGISALSRLTCPDAAPVIVNVAADIVITAASIAINRTAPLSRNSSTSALVTPASTALTNTPPITPAESILIPKRVGAAKGALRR
jgi:hypothetical protein